ncbi:hypothetical protein F383_34608 [Gossypium arboreum]|uniref:Uncharacterized protein n=1 Tax=Gossypium arboreum TaxID=29729 RepID=A0A0B0PQQ0_GOSAR|nr:hypothetical protein F383_33520 [Gossypium arboreum]KHG27694.1 hypothetical protein F383_34608 [Gossypium arboreum]
MDLDRRKN